jgi:hypothetical protein
MVMKQLHACQPSKHSRVRSAEGLWTCTACGTGWHIRNDGRWGRDGHELRIEVPRQDRRGSLEKCRADAQMAARSQGFMGPPDEVIPYDATAMVSEASLASPQGYIFTWYGPDSAELWTSASP